MPRHPFGDLPGVGSVRAGESDAKTGIEDVCKAWALVYSLAPYVHLWCIH